MFHMSQKRGKNCPVPTNLHLENTTPTDQSPRKHDTSISAIRPNCQLLFQTIHEAETCGMVRKYLKRVYPHRMQQAQMGAVKALTFMCHFMFSF